MGGAKLTEDTYYRHLPFSAVQKLAGIIDPGNLWEKLIVNIPRKLSMLNNDEEFEPKFSSSSVALIDQRGRKVGASFTRLILDEWSTQNVKVKHILQVLTKAELYAAADYLAVDLLKGVPVPRADIEVSRRSNLEPDGKVQREKECVQKGCEETTLYQRKQTEDICSASNSLSNSDPAYLSVNSGFPSADLKGGISSQSHREPGESDEVIDTANLLKEIIEDDDIRLRRLDYSLLKHITDNFNNTELSKGGNMIGRGGFGTVYLGQFTTGFQVAVKCLKEDNEDNLKQFTTELEVLAKYRHVNIVHLLGYSQENCNHCLVYQYMPNGSLEDRLCCKNDTVPLTWQLRIEIAKGTARGINYLNNEGLVHRDIKSANVLLDKDFIPKVGDFATARTAPKGTGNSVAMTSVVIGTSAYLAPEAYQFDVSAKLDTFSFGVVLLELLTGLPPYDPDREEKDIKSHVDENSDDIMELVDKKAGIWLEETAQAIVDLAERCVESRRKKRPLIGDILPELEKLSNDTEG